MSRWTLFSNHGHVLLLAAQDPDARLRDIAASVGITERAVQKIIRDLQDAGLLTISKYGRRNRYRVHTRKPLRHALESHCTVGQLVRLISESRSLTDIEEVPAARSEPWLKAGNEQDDAALEEHLREQPEPETEAPATVPEAPPEKPVVRETGKKPRKPAPGGEQGSLF